MTPSLLAGAGRGDRELSSIGSRTLFARTIAGAALLALVVGALFYFMVSAIRAERDASHQARVSDDRIAAAIEEQKLVVDLETGLRGYLITGRTRFLKPWNDAVASLPQTQDRLVRLTAREASSASLARHVNSDIAAYIDEHGRPLISSVANEEASLADRARITAEGKRRVDHLRGHFNTLIDTEQRTAAAARGHADAASDRAVLFGSLGLFGSVLLVVLFCAYQLRFVLRPVRRVGTAAKRLARGDLAARVAEAGGGEVGELARWFNVMADSLEQNRDELESQNFELETQRRELESAVDELAAGKARLERLYSIGRAISSATELHDVAHTVVDELADLAGAELGALYTARSRDGDEYVCVATRGLDAGELDPIRPGISLAGRAIAEERMFVTSAGGSGLAVKTLGGTIEARHEAHLPLRSGGEIVGVLTLVRIAGGPFAATDLDLLEYLAGRAGAGVAGALTLGTVRDQAAQHRAVLETSADGFLSVDAHGLITGTNPAIERLLGWTAGEAVGHKVLSFVPERFHERIEALVRDEGTTEELEALHRDGHEVPVDITLSRLERRGELTYNVFMRDVAERRRADLYMAAQYAVTRVLSESATLAEARDGIIAALGTVLGWQVGVAWIVDEDNEVLRPTSFWAAADVDAAEFLERTLGTVMRRGDMLPGRVWETGESIWIEDLAQEPDYARAAVADRAGLRGSLAFPIHSGTRFIGMAEFYSNEVERPDPELLALLATVGTQFGQFTERKRAENEADRLKDEFFALVSHELRTPLTSIIGYLEMVLETASLDTDSQRFLNVVERNSRRLHRLVGDLLFVAQVEAGRLSLDRDPVPLSRVVCDSVEAARPGAEEAGVNLRLRADVVDDCQGDIDRLGQMLDNLISNAVKFTASGGNVDVYVTQRESIAYVEVRDSGVGIPAEEQGRLFQRFYRSSTATRNAIPGVGLGLTISRAIVEAHGGTIGFESEEGRGTTFRVELPLEQERSGHETSDTPREVVL